jgi:hypothetical protein
MAIKLLLTLTWLIPFSIFSYTSAQGFNLIRYDSFEEYEVGTSTLDYWKIQNCGVGPSCGTTCVTDPLIVTDEQSRAGGKSLRFQRINDDKVITGGDYCSSRNEIANWNDAFGTYGDHVWFGFSVYIADNHLQDQWSANNVTIFQFKNIDAGGGGNSYGSLKSYRKDGTGPFLWNIRGYGDVGEVKLNQWTDIVIHLKYGINNDGIVEAWIGDDYVFIDNISFPAKLACYPKFGTYSDVMGPDAPMQKLYFDEIKMGKASDGASYYDEVVPAFVCRESAAPAIPGNFTGLASGVRKISLRWEHAGEALKGFNLERKSGNEDFSFLAQLTANTMSYVDKDVVDGNTYTYRISSYNCFGSSSPGETEVFLEKDHTQLLPIQSVSASSYLGNYKPENVIDNQLNTYWMIEGENEWLQLDISDVAAVHRVTVSFVNGNSRIYSFHIDASMDGNLWNRVKSFTSSGEDNDLNDYALDEVSCKYIRFITAENTVDNRTWLAEIQLWGFLSTQVKKNVNQNPFQIRHLHRDNKIEIVIHDELLHNCTLSIYNILGILTRSYSFNENSTLLDIKDLSPGLYLLTLQGANYNTVQKIWIP